MTLTFVMCAGLADAPDRRIGPLFVAVVLMCDALVFAFAEAIATLVIGEWSVLSMWTKIAGIVPLTITFLEFPLTCAGALLQS